MRPPGLLPPGGPRPHGGPAARALPSTSTWEAEHHGGCVRAKSRLHSGWAPRQPPSELRSPQWKNAVSLLSAGRLTHQAQLGLPPAAWQGYRLAPTLAFPMTPFKIHHVPSLGPSINNSLSSQGLPAHQECQALGIRIWLGPALGAGTLWPRHPGSLGSRCPFPQCPPLGGSWGRCRAQPQAWVSPGPKVIQITLRTQILEVHSARQEHRRLWAD